MIDNKVLQEENKRWHEEHLAWLQETEQWQHETQRLLALLYLLERALPEHTSMLNKHAILIAENERQLSHYEYGFNQHTDAITQKQHIEFHQKLSKLHEEAKQEHLKLQHTYSEEMNKFKLLVLELLKEC